MTPVALVLVVGCSSSSTPAAGPASITFSADGTPGMVGATTSGSMPMPMPGDSGSAAAPAASDAPHGSNAVNISNFTFAPASLTIPAGSTVTWTNKDEEPHTVVSSDGSTFHSPGMDTGGTYSFTFKNTGTFEYICSIHPMMHGTVVVTK
ncbi:cupredoxin family copper-binding protein [Mycobacterium sp. AZCC_0083]|uniref:cupredoxin domain-containing protein n=1 Tax=Mycobacterium sp. AZCC_0083 TaxID=2735882 RepID=UPI00161FC7DD|nr:cupredoxin family copper-binding protein [Mycobacterium sp. AZCC_0083]MBB5161996.1 plastocyanin [Mycobacterium sp. AZCC_0083]